jgi:erythromycin esterase-like protein
MFAVGLWYEDFAQTTDEEVRELLAPARRRAPARTLERLHPLPGTAADYDWLVERASEARCLLLGEATHGTHEFYRERAEITKRLISEAGYTALAVEADWPDAYRVNRYVRGLGEDKSANEALSGFRRFPAWLWRNTVVRDFVEWLRKYNERLPDKAAKVGFYGLDLYSLHTSMAAVITYLDEVDAEAAARARQRYSCFDQFGPDPQVYAYEAGIAGAEPCEPQVIEVLSELQSKAVALADDRDADSGFYAEQNARLVVNAEQYYRSIFRGGSSSWNLRDRHMAETLDALLAHLEGRRHGRRGPARVALWEHNSHLGDARATELGQAGELNVGQLARERYGDEAMLVAFTTCAGTVTAASRWGGAAERKQLRPALEGSWEALFHEQGPPRFLLETAGLDGRRLERAIGVVYLPETERQSHYFYARMADQFDAVVHFDQTSALEPLERTSEWEIAELPETYPSGV